MTIRTVASFGRLALLAVCLSGGGGACGGAHSSEGEDVGETVQPLTTIIPTSRTCTHDVVSSGCLDVPPKQVHGCSSRFGCNPVLCLPGKPCEIPLPDGIDGVLSPREYDGATELPYTDQALRAEAKVRVKAFQYDSGFNKGEGYLNVYFEDMPFTPGAFTTAGLGGGQRSSLFVVYVDFNRFNGANDLVEPEDRFFVIDLTGTSPATIYRKDSSSVFTTLGAAHYHPGTCKPDPSTSAIWRCNGELRIPLGNAMKRFPSPDDDVDPGVGFEVFPFTNGISDTTYAGLPEAYTAVANFGALISNRRLAVSLLFARPKGYRVQYMTWNIRRSSVSKLAGDFSETPDLAVGEWLADKADVIGLQEGWNKDKMKAVLAAAADRRNQLNLDPFYVAGPPDVEGGLFKDALSELGSVFAGGDEGSSGGLWTLSKFPIAQTDFHVYSANACKGEDCLKAKSVLWTRVMLNPPSPANTGCGLSILRKERCGSAPSGGDFVDVFNTHLNATDTQLCSDETTRTLVKAHLVDLIALGGGLEPWLLFAEALLENDFNCDLSDSEIQQRQLDEMNTFIASHAATDRPSVILGDFNIDGRQLGHYGPTGASQYRELVRRLHLGPVNPQALYGNAAADNDDMANPWPLDFDWDIDHSDLARDAVVPYPSTGNCMGTFIGKYVNSSGLCASSADLEASYPNGLDVCYRNGCGSADNADGHFRYDYALVRPPFQTDDPSFKAAKWVAEKVPSEPWHSPYPGPPPAGNVFSGPPYRLSDHKPVLVGLEHAKLVQAPRFHPRWRHDLDLRVASYDASNRGDCSGCDDVDPYISRWSVYKDQANQSHVALNGNDSSTCANTAANSYPPARCMENWNATFSHQGTERAHAFGPYLFDADSSSSDDSLYLHNGGTQPVMWVLWGATTRVGLRGWHNQSLGTVDWPIGDTEPIPISTIAPGAEGPTNQCLLFSATELPPGQQF